MLEKFDIAEFVMTLTAVVLGITVHEFAHAITADRLGDDTPRRQGRVTLWPGAHLDPIGSLLFLIAALAGRGLGWGKPVQTDPSKYVINQRLGMALVTAAGPASNLVIAMAFALVLRAHWLPYDDAFTNWIEQIVWVNASLFLFNLLPVYPLDGSKLLAAALPPRMGDAFLGFMAQFGWMVLFALVMSRALNPILTPAITHLYIALTGY